MRNGAGKNGGIVSSRTRERERSKQTHSMYMHVVVITRILVICTYVRG